MQNALKRGPPSDPRNLDKFRAEDADDYGPWRPKPNKKKQAPRSTEEERRGKSPGQLQPQLQADLKRQEEIIAINGSTSVQSAGAQVLRLRVAHQDETLAHQRASVLHTSINDGSTKESVQDRRKHDNGGHSKSA